MADARDLKSLSGFPECGFESRRRHPVRAPSHRESKETDFHVGEEIKLVGFRARISAGFAIFCHAPMMPIDSIRDAFL